MADSVEDAAEDKAAMRIRLIEEHLHTVSYQERRKVAVACDAVTSVADVVAEANGRVRGLKEAVQVALLGSANLPGDGRQAR